MENFNDTLNSIENALKENTINEGQYIKLMNLAKKRFDKQNDEIEINPLKSHGDIMLGLFDNIHHGNYVVVNTADLRILSSNYTADVSFPVGGSNYRKFHRLSDAEVYYKELAGI
tara:strand:- start:24 stop:368 length:345 start_codon:yes stop_codon:yes gene_type:complete